MPRKPKPPAKAVTTPELNVPRELLDQLVKGPMTQGDLESMFLSTANFSDGRTGAGDHVQ
jgi:hypothetical protein